MKKQKYQNLSRQILEQAEQVIIPDEETPGENIKEVVKNDCNNYRHVGRSRLC